MEPSSRARITTLVETLRVNALGAKAPDEPVVAHRQSLNELLRFVEREVVFKNKATS